MSLSLETKLNLMSLVSLANPQLDTPTTLPTPAPSTHTNSGEQGRDLKRIRGT